MQPVLACTFALLLAADAAPRQQPQPPTGRAMARAADALLAALTPPQRAQVLAPLDDPHRCEWNFVPGSYAGLKLGDLEAGPHQLVQQLLRTALSAAGYRKVQQIVALEQLLRELESTPGHDAAHRDPGRYWLQLHGTPGAAAPWTLSLQGHHVSLHFAVVGDDVVATTPSFLGANPHQQRSGPQQGQRVLGGEEDKARALLASLDARQLQAATLQAEAPADIILGPTRAADFLGAPKGVAYRDLAAEQQRLLWQLLLEFADNLPADVQQRQLQRIEQRGRDGICFGWAGSRERGKGHYWRLHGPGFAIEYDNTQDDANHVHTVWRDLSRDFGGDLLRQHVEHEHK